MRHVLFAQMSEDGRGFYLEHPSEGAALLILLNFNALRSGTVQAHKFIVLVTLHTYFYLTRITHSLLYIFS
ncbi:hypothetical protein AAKU61_004635 [Undibacterium sp. GrIS 1.2]